MHHRRIDADDLFPGVHEHRRAPAGHREGARFASWRKSNVVSASYTLQELNHDHPADDDSTYNDNSTYDDNSAIDDDSTHDQIRPGRFN